MKCTNCALGFRFAVWIMQCGECKDQYCTKCMKRANGIYYCEKCVVLIMRPPDINELMKLKSKDLQDYLRRHDIPTLGLVEKRELVELLCNRAIPVKSTKTNAVFNKIFTNFESVFLNDRNGESRQTSPTSSTGRPPPNPPVRPRPPERPVYPCTSSGNLSSGITLNVDPARTPHTLPKDTRPSAPPTEPTTSTFTVADSSPKRYPRLSDYHSSEDLTILSAKELKILLTANRVDYKGCLEKSELLEKVQRLWLDKQKHENLPDNVEDLCKVCMDAPLDCVLLECGHIASCVDCGKRLAECPICRQYVSRVVRTFKA